MGSDWDTWWHTEVILPYVSDNSCTGFVNCGGTKFFIYIEPYTELWCVSIVIVGIVFVLFIVRCLEWF